MYRKLKVGDPKDGASNLGPLGSKEHKAKVTSYIDLAHQGAGRVVCGHGVDSLDLPENIKHVSMVMFWAFISMLNTVV